MSSEGFQIDGDIKMSALLLMKKNFFFGGCFSEYVHLGTAYPGKSYTRQRLLPQVTWLWDREERQQVPNEPFNMLACPSEQCRPMAITHQSSNLLLWGVGARVSRVCCLSLGKRETRE